MKIILGYLFKIINILIYNISIENMLSSIKKNSRELRETVLQNIIHMLIDRKFLNTKNKQHYLTEIKKKITSEDISFNSDYDHPYIINIKFLTENNVGKKQNLVKILDYTNKKNHYVLIVIDNKVNKFLKDFKRISNIEIFNYSEFFLNVTDHQLVPKHTILTQSEKEEVLKQYNCSIEQIPKLWKTDRIARHYNMQPGSICKIERISEVTGKAITYRHVVLGAL
tara:strand:+ start:140 stop:814 length:675 start_codon:yes stop_codon:yes gene_type:complete